MQCSSTSFRINHAGDDDFGTAEVGTNCSEDYIGIEASSNSGFGTQSRYCGGYLNSHQSATIDAKVRGL